MWALISANILDRGYSVIGIDNFRRESYANISPFADSKKFNFACLDISGYSALYSFCEKFSVKNKIKECWHLAANSDISSGIANPDIDLMDTFLTTQNLLKVMKQLNIKKLALLPALRYTEIMVLLLYMRILDRCHLSLIMVL